MWIDEVDNTLFLKRLYRKVPDLIDVRVLKVSLDENGPTLGLNIDLPKYAENPPEKWVKNNYNLVQINMIVSGVRKINIKGWSIDNIASVKITEISNYKSIVIQNELGFELKAEGIAISISEVNAYYDEAIKPEL